MLEEQTLDVARHERAAFVCGVPVLDAYLAQLAAQHVRKGVSAVYVLIDTNVLSELRRKRPDTSVVNWFIQRAPATLYGCRNAKYPISGGTGGRIASLQIACLAELNGTICA